MLDTKMRIDLAKANIRKAEQAKTVAETQKAAAETQKQEIENKMVEAGVTPDTINDVILQLETQVQEDLTKVERLIPTDI
ncbi:hypothetical protein [Lysinibacillus sp. 54212]|uniref:hypothetical protein n=1 Tax=Lysinibacillus sp. 54212 TaxID=3119829 RepID=UPI002FCA81EF